MSGSKSLVNINAVRLEIIRNALVAISEEMSTVLYRTSRSISVREGKDHSTAIFDAAGNNIAQAARVPIHLNTMGPCLGDILSRFIPAAQWGEGDVVMVNDPYCGAQHLPDVATFAPVFDDGMLVGFVGCMAHQVDVGGGAPGSYDMNATEIFQEGLRIPPIRIKRAGVLNEEAFALILQNTRQPALVRSDLLSQLAATAVGVAGMGTVSAKYGRAVVTDAALMILSQSEAAMRRRIAIIPDGSYSFADVVDGEGGAAYTIAATVTVSGEAIRVDLSDSADQVKLPINCTINITSSCVYYAVMAAAGGDVPANAGCYALVEIVARPGSIVNCNFPAPVASRITVGHRIVNVIMGAMSKALPDRIPAAYYGVTYACLIGMTLQDGSTKVMADVEIGGWGAEPKRDGASAFSCGLHNNRNMPVEMMEAAYPVRFTTYTLRQDSFGPGRYRGGLGLIREWELLAETGSMSVTLDRVTSRPFGLAGGLPAATGRVVLTRDDDGGTPLPSKVSGISLKRGDRVRMETSGGGGFGLPSERDDAAIQADLREGYMSPAMHARIHAGEDVQGA